MTPRPQLSGQPSTRSLPALVVLVINPRIWCPAESANVGFLLIPRPAWAPPLPAELPSSAGALVEGAIPLCIQRQAVRLLAMLACDKSGAGEVEAAGWVPWLQELALSQDLKLSSCASRALLHIESAAATDRPGLGRLTLGQAARRGAGAPLLPTEQHGSAAAAPGGGLQGGAPGSPGGEASGVVAEAAEMLGEARHALVQARRRLDRRLDAVRPPLPPEQRLVMQVRGAAELSGRGDGRHLCKDQRIPALLLMRQ